MNIKLSSIVSWLSRFLCVQLFITLASLPILINWGLPLSVMSPLANLIFTPFLMFFLLLSSFIFFLELFYIPNGFFIYFLEQTVAWWHYCLSLGSPSWLIGFAQPSFLFFIFLLSATFFIMHYKKIASTIQLACCFIVLSVLTGAYLKLQNKSTSILPLACNKGTITIIRSNDQTIVVDPGVLGRRTSTNSWLEYTLLTTLNKTFGTACIDHLVIMQPGILTFEAVTTLCLLTPIKNLYLVTWEGPASKSFYRMYGLLKKVSQEKNITIHRLGSWQKKIQLCPRTIFTIEPLQTMLPYQDLTYPALCLSGSVDNQKITIYSAKMKYKENIHEL